MKDNRDRKDPRTEESSFPLAATKGPISTEVALVEDDNIAFRCYKDDRVWLLVQTMKSRIYPPGDYCHTGL